MDVMKACSQGGYYICGMDWRSLDWTRRVADGGDTRQLSVLHLPPKHWSNLRFSGPVQSMNIRGPCSLQDPNLSIFQNWPYV